MRIIAYILATTLIVGLLLGFGLHGAWRQHEVLHTYQPVNATINKNEVKQSKLGGYTPDLLYTYTAKGQTYENSQAAPLFINGSSSWAETISQRITAQGSTAYVNPLDPGQAYLLPVGRFRPYGLTLAGIVLLTVSVFPMRAGGVLSRKPLAITGGPFDWYSLSPGGTYPDRATIWCVASVIWYLLGIIVIAHYYLTTPPSYEIKSVVISGLYLFAGTWIAWRALSACTIASRLGAPKAQMTKKTVALGEPVIVRIEQPFLRNTQIREIRITLTCYRRTGLGSEKYYASSQFAAQNRTVRVGEKIQSEFTFEVPQKKQHPSTRFSRLDYPRTDWQIEVTTRTDRSSATVNFPILAEHSKRATKAA